MSQMASSGLFVKIRPHLVLIRIAFCLWVGFELFRIFNCVEKFARVLWMFHFKVLVFGNGISLELNARAPLKGVCFCKI